MKKSVMRGLAFVMALTVALAGVRPVVTQAAMVNTSENHCIISKSVPQGKTGRRMNVSFVVRNFDEGRTWKDVEVGIANNGVYIAGPNVDEAEYIFPFEVTTATFQTKHLGTITSGNEKSVSLPVRVRADLPEGYYTIEIEVFSEGSMVANEFLNVWISKPTGTEDEEEDEKEVSFVLGENQATPYGVYPNVVDFAINMRNKGLTEARDVNVAMVLDKDSAVFPFDINDGNYDRNFEKIDPNETVQMAYSMAIRSDAYSGYYPIKFNINYRETATGTIKTEEDTFWVRIKNKEKDDDSSGDFNENDRTKARIVVDSFDTIPETIIAGEPFRLILRMKNASSSIAASNILFSLESEKVDNSAIFTTESGSSSVVVNSLAAGEVTELTIDLLSRAGIDQRSYAMTIKETYDSPEYKNASESVTIDIPIKQIARLNTGTIEVMPDNLTVGSESNVMFPINNTGKVILYNVMVAFEADSIQPTDTYVGNIKPGETGNVDVMLASIAPTMDEGKVKILITYEDENGEVQPAVEKELSLFVMEAMDDEFMMDIDVGNFDDMPVEDSSFMGKYKIPVAAAAATVLAAAAFVVIRRRRKKTAAQEEDFDDEIS